jgi:transcriptional regulator with XRE-family HTH domain
MNWNILIRALTNRERGGVTQVELARRCECGQSTISELARGVTSTPNANLGLKLLELHSELFGSEKSPIEGEQGE